MENEKMNILEAFKHLFDGKKIRHKDSDSLVYWLLGNEMTLYFRNSENGNKETPYYSFARTELRIGSSKLDNWMVFDEPCNIPFAEYQRITVPELLQKGYTLKRLTTGKCYNKTDTFTVEDVGASDWVIEDL